MRNGQSFIQSLLFGCVRVFLRPKASCHFLVKGYQYAAITSSAAKKVSMAFHRKFSLNVPMYMYTFPAKRSLNLDTSIPRFKVHTRCKHCNCYHFGQNSRGLVFFLLARNQVYCVTPYVASLHTLDIPQIAIALEFLECPSTTSWSPLCDTDELMMRVN